VDHGYGSLEIVNLFARSIILKNWNE